MKTYLSRVKETIQKGKKMYQPQIRRKTKLSFLLDWQALSMLIIYTDSEPQRAEIKIWTENKNEAQLELDRFAYLHKEIKIIQ
jgi:hypothetical protein